MDGADQRIALHVQAEPAIHAEFIEFPQSGNGNGECDGEKNAQKTVAPIFLIQKDGNIGAEQCENNAAAEMQHLVPMLDAVVELVDPAGHRRKNVKQTEHKQCVGHTPVQTGLQQIGKRNADTDEQTDQRIGERSHAQGAHHGIQDKYLTDQPKPRAPRPGLRPDALLHFLHFDHLSKDAAA